VKEAIASGIVVVRVTMTDSLIGGQPTIQLWGAALPRDQAVAAVEEKIPAHWTAELTEQRLPAEYVRRMRMKLGSVRMLGDADA
jgi:hypothetical protein